ncbi:hypothetical protein KEM54_001458 [Ascosphaera aggregata]|nr:hypothetical protein KEM54_001458 [Ascosphaera aggregata]
MTLEIILALFLATFGLVLGSQTLKPISWSVWAENIEEKGGHDNPFRAYEDRLSFWDVRSSRQEFADWVRQQESSQNNPSS